jgi:hypothetical protein
MLGNNTTLGQVRLTRAVCAHRTRPIEHGEGQRVASEASQPIPSGSQADAIFRDLISRWHQTQPELQWPVVLRHFPSDLATLSGQIEQLGLINCYQWHLEDECRGHYASQSVLAELKHAIDESNHRRVRAIDLIDEAYARQLQARSRANGLAHPALITPGALMDRLSILELKRYHAEHADARTLPHADRTAALLREQIADLCQGVDAFVQDLLAGRVRLKLYPSVKLYGSG